MKKLIILTFVLVMLGNYCFAQDTNQVHLTFKVAASGYTNIALVKLGLRSHLKTDPDIEIPMKSGKVVSKNFILPTKGFYQIADGYKGHIIFLRPNDTATITLHAIPNLQKRMQNGEALVKFLTIDAKSRYPGNLLFFDAFEAKVGYAIKYKHGESPEHFTARCDSAYRIGKQLLATYQKKGMVSNDFEYYAMAQIRSWYILCFSEMLYFTDKKKVPDACLKMAKSFSFNDSILAFSTRDYMTAASVYNMYIANDFRLGEKGDGYANLLNEFASIIHNHSGIIKDQLMAWSVIDYANKDYQGYDSIYQQFLSLCQSSVIKQKTIRRVEQLKSLPTPSKAIARPSLQKLLAETMVENEYGKQIRLSTLLADTVVTLIDCWASWCAPCIEQMPITRETALRYKGKIKLIYLSFDKDEWKWKKSIQRHAPSKQDNFIVTNNFSSAFAKYFDISTIPRYILLAPKGLRVLQEKMPPPAMTDQFDALVKKYFTY